MAEVPRNIGILPPKWWKKRATEVGELKKDAVEMFQPGEVVRCFRNLRILYAYGKISAQDLKTQQETFKQIARELKITQDQLNASAENVTTTPPGRVS